MVLTIFVVSFIAIITIVLLLQLKFSLFTLRIHPFLIRNATLLGSYRSIIAFIGFPVVIIGGLYTYSQLIDRLDNPNVGLEFVHKSNAAVNVLNLSNIVVYDPKYWIAFFNIDSPLVNERRNPLQIPVSTGDYIRVGDKWGPNAMISIAVSKGEVKKGDRIIGIAAATCPKCIKRFYWVYIKEGEGGWYAEISDDEIKSSIQLPINSPSSDDAISVFFNLVPEKGRVPIK